VRADGDQVRVGKRTQRQDDRGRIAARHRHEIRGRDRLGVQFRKSIRGAGEQIGSTMFEAVVPRIVARIGEAKRRREIEDDDAAFEQFRREIVARLVRRGEEDRRGIPRENAIEASRLDRTFRKASQPRMRTLERDRLLSAATGAEEAHDLRVAMSREQRDEFASGVAGGTNDRDACHEVWFWWW
jgi:hypothetical protein